jgi:hypothetical protein
MPARHLVLAIVLFWVGTSGWLFYRDLWPYLRPGDAPPFTIDLAFEAQRQSSTSSWRILRGDKGIGMVHTEVRYRDEDDTFELHSNIKQLDLEQIGPIQIQAKEVHGMYRVTRQGTLRQMTARATVEVQGRGIARGLRASALLDFNGKVHGAQFVPQGYIEFGGQREFLKLEPVEFSAQVSVLNPLHPVNRIVGLRRGQHWQQRLVDPLADSLRAMVQKDPALDLVVQKNQGVKVLQAEVQSQLQTLTWDNAQVPCLVIEYRSDDLAAHTWVREIDGKVLRQEATLWGERLVLERL